MGIVDVFREEDRLEITYSNFYKLLKEAAKAELITNAVNCNVPNKHIKAMITGGRDEEIIMFNNKELEKFISADTPKEKK